MKGMKYKFNKQLIVYLPDCPHVSLQKLVNEFELNLVSVGLHKSCQDILILVRTFLVWYIRAPTWLEGQINLYRCSEK
jgi:hypothetical protein